VRPSRIRFIVRRLKIALGVAWATLTLIDPRPSLRKDSTSQLWSLCENWIYGEPTAPGTIGDNYRLPAGGVRPLSTSLCRFRLIELRRRRLLSPRLPVSRADSNSWRDSTCRQSPIEACSNGARM
jgi:hypothetical protein